ncbi:hypothetical protein, partial [Flavonifractor sp. DFI.6.63]|uniref:hypothetical protein n=1 Tax=Flavonifractor sp. DFI.6.63 TaxID=2963704 RepID=UPI00210BF8E0
PFPTSGGCPALPGSLILRCLAHAILRAGLAGRGGSGRRRADAGQRQQEKRKSDGEFLKCNRNVSAGLYSKKHSRYHKTCAAGRTGGDGYL